MSRALLIVDVQNDFCPGGSLAVSDGDRILPAVNRLIREFTAAGLPVFATRDWHPEDHCSFRARGGCWPPHCVAGTRGAAFHPELQLTPDVHVVDKGERQEQEAYSGFEGTDLASRLRELGVDEIVVCGLATDYCVKATALDARREGLGVTVVEDAVRGVELEPGDSERALAAMRQAGVQTVPEAAPYLGSLRVGDDADCAR